MRHLLTTILTFVLFATFGQTQNDRVNKTKKLNILMLTLSTVVLQKGIINSEDSHNFISLYDERGRPTEDRIINLKEGSITVYKYKYGNCDEYNRWEWLQYQGEKIDTINIQTVSFNKNCKMEKIVWTKSKDSITDVRYFTYDENGRPTKEEDKDSKNVLTSFVLYFYPDSFTIDKKGFFGDSSFWYHTREYFDKKGNIVNTSSLDEKGTETFDEGKNEYIYKDSLLTESIKYDLKGKVVARTTYSYNSDNLLERTISKSLNTEDDIETISTYRYVKRN